MRSAPLMGALVVLACAIPRLTHAQTVTVTVPSAVSFAVSDVSATTTGSPISTQVSFSNPSGFSNGQKLRISVQPDTTTFAGPGTTHIAASKVSWTASASSGTPSNGTLAAGTYTLVYQSAGNVRSAGSVNLRWSLAPIAAAGLRSGTHTLTIRWKFEAF